MIKEECFCSALIRKNKIKKSIRSKSKVVFKLIQCRFTIYLVKFKVILSLPINRLYFEATTWKITQWTGNISYLLLNTLSRDLQLKIFYVLSSHCLNHLYIITF